MTLTGTVRADARSPSGVEIGLSDFGVDHLTADFPITRPGTLRVQVEPAERRDVRSGAPALAPTFRAAPVRPPIGRTNALVASSAEEVGLADAVLALGFPLREIVLAFLQHFADGRELLVGKRHFHQCTTAFGS